MIKKLYLIQITLIGLFLGLLFTFQSWYFNEIENNFIVFFYRFISNFLISTLITFSIFTVNSLTVVFLEKKLPWKKFIVKRIIIEFFVTNLFATIIITIIFTFLYSFLKPEWDFRKYIFYNILSSIIINTIIVSIYEAGFLFNKWKESFIKNEVLMKENIMSQYETLKNQVNPHFLFNSFNVLTTLIEENPKSAVVFVSKLSDFFRDILKYRQLEVITLKEELDLIQNYYFLQKGRYGDNLTLLVDIPNSFLNSCVPPLSLQMLLENAIKHNVVSREKPLKIEISTSKDEYIIIKNNLQKKFCDESSNKIGLQNITNRYKFLSEKKVEIIVSSINFIVALPILRFQEGN